MCKWARNGVRKAQGKREQEGTARAPLSKEERLARAKIRRSKEQAALARQRRRDEEEREASFVY
jgi:hypothetical protein